MTDEIASFKVTAADNQKQKVHPSGDVHMQSDSHFISLVFIFKFIFSSLSSCFQMMAKFKSIACLCIKCKMAASRTSYMFFMTA